MIEITIIGWYGTETIGDRAILAGLIRAFSRVFADFSIRLGSLHPFFSQRVLIEDFDFHKRISGHRLHDITIFDSLSKPELHRNIRNCSFVAIGGGPLMDLDEMFMLRDAFRFAKRHHIPRAILGCGWGPVNTPRIQKCAAEIVNLADLTVFRDSDSLAACRFIVPQAKALASIDPAFFAADFFRINHARKNAGNYIAANFRDIICSDAAGFQSVDHRRLVSVIDSATAQSGMPVKLVPQHTFFLGGDDRDLFNVLATKCKNVEAINNPTSLEQTLTLYRDASACIGMRFHSAVLQLVTSGRNIIVDYTDPQTGKIISMLRQLSIMPQHASRYFSLHSSSGSFSIIPALEEPPIVVSSEVIKSYFDIYTRAIDNLAKNN